MSDSPEERRPKRQKRETSYKAKAFEKFKQLKSGTRNKYEIEELESVYETVDEKEYVKRVLDRQDDDWIVDDDGSGYVEDGRDIFDDDLDSASIAQASKGKGTKRKKKAVSENAGKGNLQFMLSNMPAKKKEEVKIADDNMLSEILEEIDETPNVIKPKTIEKSSLLSQKQAAKDYMKSFSMPFKKPKPKYAPVPQRINSGTSLSKNMEKMTVEEVNGVERRILGSKNEVSNVSMNEIVEDIPQGVDEMSNNFTDEEINNFFEDDFSEKTNVPERLDNLDKSETQQNSENLTIEEDPSQSVFDDDIDLTVIEQFDSQQENETDNITSIMNNIEAEFSCNWGETDGSLQTDSVPVDRGNLPLITSDDRKVFRFYWWDAYENYTHRGTVYLFGKTYCEKTKGYVSCCVAVQNISRHLYVLPRPFVMDKNDQPTDKPVTKMDVYNEFNDGIMKPSQIKKFRSRFVHKKYAFNPEIPTESEYMEVQYPATDPNISFQDLNLKPKTFSKIFGLNTSYLEILLLERKIKGPCWLDIIDPVSVTNPVSWCKFEVDCKKVTNVCITEMDKPLPPPPLVVASINFRYYFNPKTFNNEIVMLSCVSHRKYAPDKQAPNPPFQEHFCIFSNPSQQPLPLDIHETLNNYKATKVQKMNSEKALLNYFINQFSRIDPDLIVGHDLQGYQMNVLSNRLMKYDVKTFSQLGRIKRTDKKKLEREMFVGRLVCDIKTSAKELIKSRSYDLDSLCQAVLKTKENQRMDFEPEEIPKMYQDSQDIVKLISLTMQDTAFILKIMYSLNVIPLALQITNIAGNVMSRTLMGGRSERNEFLLLHAFTEKGYIVPDKEFWKRDNAADRTRGSKKPTYSGGLVLDPKVGFYDQLILLMDFNSLYPSIIQEYNICFTTLPVSNVKEENLVLPDKNLPPGILPTEIRKLVESRRSVKTLMNNPDISEDLRIQYHIRQMALKLTANSMYGCLGFSNSRFYAKNLAALVTMKGREILVNTRDLVQKMCLEVVYGDTDSIMINTNILDYDQVFKIGNKIKQEVNKLYKHVELDIDGVFKYLLLLKKKKYAAVSISKTKDGKLKEQKEYKGLDIVRRDWSQLAAEAGKFILEHILSDQSAEDRIGNVRTYLSKIKEDLTENRVPIQLLVITKQLTKDPTKYNDKNSLPHVQVALRYNKESGGHFRAGDTVSYVICDDGSNKSATQRAYHLDELKNSETLKIDINYYLSQQIHPVVSRICDPIEGFDAFQIADWLGIDSSSFKAPRQQSQNVGENITKPEFQFRNVDKFTFKCLACNQQNSVDNALVGNLPFLEKCTNTDCNVRPVDYIAFIQNQLSFLIRSYIAKYYSNNLICEDPACPNTTHKLVLKFSGKYPICNMCNNGVMYRTYTEKELYTQLLYFHHIFDLNKVNKKPLMEQQIEYGFHTLRDTVQKYLNHSGFSVINLTNLLGFSFGKKQTVVVNTAEYVRIEIDDDDDEMEF